MQISRVVGKLLPLAVVFLTACSAAVELAGPPQTDASPSAAAINAAAARVAATEDGAAETPASEAPSLDSVQAPTAEPTDSPQDQVPQRNPRGEVPGNLRVSWLIPFDGIRPVYNPQFATVDDAPLADDELIIGISLDGEAKAYPITVLRFREMVNDELAGIPTLVTW